jgi:hypothetical protein
MENGVLNREIRSPGSQRGEKERDARRRWKLDSGNSVAGKVVEVAGEEERQERRGAGG